MNAPSSIDDALNALRKGGMVLLLDDETRENEGDLVLAAQFATAEKIHFLDLHARGLLCVALDATLVEKFQLPLQPQRNYPQCGPAFTVSIDARKGITTGISAQDRARTLQLCADPQATADDLITPGHVFPLKAHAQGLKGRQGHTEGSIELLKLAKLPLAAILCEVLNDQGGMPSREELLAFSKRNSIPMAYIQNLIS